MKYSPFMWMLAWLIAAAASESRAADASAPPNPKPLEYMIMVTGGELLEGIYPDGHTPFITRTLRPLGCRCVGSMVVDDVREEIEQALAFATNHAALVIVTGGLGPTPNDITRETLAEFTGIPLCEDAEVLAQMERRFQHSKEPLRPNLRKQCLVPARGGYLNNANGTAVGLIFDQGRSVVVSLPGPPRELQPMVKDELIPFMRRRFGVRPLGASLTLRFVGAGQSLIDQTIKDHLSIAPDVTITSLFEGGRVDFTFTLPGNSPADQSRLKRLETDLRQHLEEYVYADDGSSLEDVVAGQLIARGGSLALVEIGSGGQLAASLTRAKGIDRLLAGAWVGPNAASAAQWLGAPAPSGLAEKQLEALVTSAARLMRSQSVIATGPLETDAKSGQFVRVAFQLGNAPIEYQPLGVRDASESSRAQLTTQILDRLRRLLIRQR